MNNKDGCNWFYGTLDEIIDCEYTEITEEKKSEKHQRKRSAEAINDSGKSGGNNKE